MTPDENEFLYELEERYWWFAGMRKIVAAMLDRAVPAGPLRILDAGCGTGLMLSWLRRHSAGGAIFGLDFSSEALGFSAQRGERRLVEGSIAALPFPNACFDLVTTFDVLDSFEVADVSRPFGELARVLKPGGIILLRVPAFQYLYGRHDRAVYTKHRYRIGELRQRLEAQDLVVERVTYANTILFPVAALWRMLTRSGGGDPQSDVRPLPRVIRWLNPVLAALLGIEAAWLRHTGWRLPFGLSAIALARKPAGAAAS